MVLDSIEIRKHYISCCKVAISKSKARGEDLGKYLLNPSDMIQETWDPVYKVLIKVIEANKGIFPRSDVKLFEIGVGTGYLLFKIEHSVCWIKTSGMDVAEKNTNQFHMMRRMLGVDQRVKVGGIYDTESPSALLQNDILFTCLPIFELEWKTNEWRKFLSSIFQNPASKVKLFFCVTNSSRDRDYFLVHDENAWRGICEAFLITKRMIVLRKI